MNGADVKLSVEDHGVMVDSCVAELRQLFSHLEESSVVPVVAIDIKYLPRKLGPIYYDAALLILCVRTRCLIVQLTHTSPLPESITELLRDENVFFVGTGDQNGFETLLEWTGMHGCKTVVDLGKMVTRFLHNPDIETAGLFQLARKLINLRLEETESGTFSDWGARVFSYEQVKLAIQNAYAVYQIATFLFKVFVNEHFGLDPIKYCGTSSSSSCSKSRKMVYTFPCLFLCSFFVFVV